MQQNKFANSLSAIWSRELKHRSYGDRVIYVQLSSSAHMLLRP